MKRLTTLIIVIILAFSLQTGKVISSQLVWAYDTARGMSSQPEITLSNLPAYVAVHRVNQPIGGIWQCSEIAAELGALVQPTDIMFHVSFGDGKVPPRVRVSAHGAGVHVEPMDSTSYASLRKNSYHYNNYTGLVTLRVQPTMGGTLMLSVWAYDEDGDFVGSVEQEIPVLGYVIEVRPKTIKLGEKVDIEVSVREIDGTPVEDAKAILWGWFTPPEDVGGPFTSIHNGNYCFREVVYHEAQMLSLMVVNQNDRVMAYLPNAIAVEGEQAYSIDIQQDNLLAGVQSSLSFRVYDDNGLIRENLISQDGKIYLAGEDVTLNAEFDLDTAVYTISNAVVTGNAELVVTSDYGKYYGKTEVPVLLPQLELSANTLTDGFMEPLSIVIRHPITGEELRGCLKITEIGLASAEYWIEPGRKADRRLIEGLISAEHTFWVRASGTDGRESALQFDVMLDALVPLNRRVKLSAPVLQVSPALMEVGRPNQVEVVYTDAHGQPLSGCTIMLGSQRARLGVTDAEGKLSTRVWPISAGTIGFFAETETPDKLAASAARSVRDAGPPVIDCSNIPLVTDQERLLLKFSVTDDTGVQMVTINGQPVELRNGTVSYSVSLERGENNLTIGAVDIFGKTASKNIRVVYQLPPDEPIMSFNINEGPAGWEALPYLDENNRTMTPLAPLAQALDVKYVYDSQTKTVVLVRGDIEVMVTVGSAMLVINGNNYTMDTIAIEQDGQVYAPLRYIVESLGFRVKFEKSTGEVHIFVQE